MITEENLSPVCAHKEIVCDPGVACIVLTVGNRILLVQLVEALLPKAVIHELVVLVAVLTEHKQGALGLRLLVVRVE